jgi:hypothetical protein
MGCILTVEQPSIYFTMLSRVATAMFHHQQSDFQVIATRFGPSSMFVRTVESGGESSVCVTFLA